MNDATDPRLSDSTDAPDPRVGVRVDAHIISVAPKPWSDHTRIDLSSMGSPCHWFMKW